MNITEGDYRMFEIYAREYKKKLSGQKTNRLDYLKDKMSEISKLLTSYAIEFCRLDLEFKDNSRELPDSVKYFIKHGKVLDTHKYITNTKWEGYWKKCTGKDLEYFISYLEYPIIYPQHENYISSNKNLISIYKRETGFDKIPYSIICAEKVNYDYFK